MKMERASRGLVMNAWRFLREIGLTKIRRISNIRSVFATCGALAQLGERNTGSVEVSGSIPLGSTNISKRYVIYNVAFFYGAPGMARSAN